MDKRVAVQPNHQHKQPSMNSHRVTHGYVKDSLQIRSPPVKKSLQLEASLEGHNQTTELEDSNGISTFLYHIHIANTFSYRSPSRGPNNLVEYS
ncbi:predicted protein [Arabidopsis lyrata subsp. lyrata]|uniref:Predicted protein n=1 Tax=Arabidopsis lyrata subsp. lyrata TaxID=81972 RepID=D7M4V7_ARALL|nr:predicted protein [Arabidopsis lyrata subsp. lyrata]